MTEYIKDGVIYLNVASIKLNGKIIINPKEEQILAAGYSVYIPEDLSDDEKLENAKAAKIAESKEYADSDELNSYVALGVTIRLPLELRLRLRNVIDSKISLGETTLTEYYEGNVFTYPITAWDEQLTQYENHLYKISCVTEQHKININALTTIEDVNNYDYTTGYPEQLNFDVDTRSNEQKLEDAIESKITEISDYADSDERNSYVAQGVTIRLSLELRLRLRSVIDARIALGETMLTEWYEGVAYVYPLTAWDIQLTQYENYLYEVNCAAEQHKQNVKALTTIEDVNNYDYTTGYPEQLDFGTYDTGSNE